MRYFNRTLLFLISTVVHATTSFFFAYLLLSFGLFQQSSAAFYVTSPTVSTFHRDNDIDDCFNINKVKNPPVAHNLILKSLLLHRTTAVVQEYDRRRHESVLQRRRGKSRIMSLSSSLTRLLSSSFSSTEEVFLHNNDDLTNGKTIRRTSFTLVKTNNNNKQLPTEATADDLKPRKRRLISQIVRPWRWRRNSRALDDHRDNISTYRFRYDYNRLVFPAAATEQEGAVNTAEKITMVLLIMPIGVGIGRWYYDRLLDEFVSASSSLSSSSNRFVVIVPDLLGCGSACDPKLITHDDNDDDDDGVLELKKLPLFTVDDWSDQLFALMSESESELDVNQENVSWCIVSNGGCTSIALEIAQRIVASSSPPSSPVLKYPLTNLILSATPSITSLLSPPNFPKIQKSFRTLSRRLVGGLFWWYSLRNNGAFIQKFSEKNLVAKKENLGEGWTPKCYETASSYGGKSRYSTFAFLAGSLNGGCEGRLEVLKNYNKKSTGGGEKEEEGVGRGDNLGVGIIVGGEMRGKRERAARSWFWEKRQTPAAVAGKVVQQPSSQPDEADNNDGGVNDEITVDKELSDSSSSFSSRKKEDDDGGGPYRATFTTYLKENGFSVEEKVISGRFCPAHEDAKGYAEAVLGFLMD